MKVFFITVTNVVIKPNQKVVLNNIQKHIMRVFILTMNKVVKNLLQKVT